MTTDDQRPVVNEIIERFKSMLDDSVRRQITQAQFADLAVMIDQAIANEAGAAADALDDMVKTLRARSRTREIGL